MSAPLKVIAALQAKLDRAERHIHDLKQYLDGWADAQRGGVRFDEDPSTGDRTYRLVDIEPLPPAIPLLIGDAVHNLRCALDHLALRLAVVGKGPGPHNRVYFPIYKTDALYTSKSVEKVEGIRPEAKKAIDDLEPYGGGSGDILWQLHSLDITDKHRLLISVASCNIRYSMPPRVIAHLKKEFLGLEPDDLSPAQESQAFQQANPHPKFPVEPGDILCTVPKDEVNENMYFSFAAVFGEQGALYGKPVTPTLNEMWARVSSVIRRFNRAGLLQ